jgi:hypothetical protein
MDIDRRMLSALKLLVGFYRDKKRPYVTVNERLKKDFFNLMKKDIVYLSSLGWVPTEKGIQLLQEYERKM